MMVRSRSESERHSLRVSLHIGASPQAAWKNVVRPWFKKIAAQPLKGSQPAAVVTASRTQGYFFRDRLIGEGESLFAVNFLSPAQLRELLLRGRDLRVPLREHLRLLLAIVSETFTTKSESEQAILKSIVRDPDRFLRALDQLRAAGWSLHEIDSAGLREIAAQF